MKKIAMLSVILITLFLTSCASSYTALHPETASFSSVEKNENGINVSYEYLTLKKKYAKKADKKDIRTVSVKIENNTDKAITYDSDFKLTTSGNEYLSVLHPNEVYENVKQKPGTHFLYLLLAPIQLQKTTTDPYTGFTETENIFPIGLVLGPAIALGNFFTAKSANTKFKNEIDQYSIYNSPIAPGESKTFLIAIRHSNYPSIRAQLIK